jgi:hypothetical protein
LAGYCGRGGRLRPENADVPDDLTRHVSFAWISVNKIKKFVFGCRFRSSLFDVMVEAGFAASFYAEGTAHYEGNKGVRYACESLS